MFFIVVHHFCVHVIFPDVLDLSAPINHAIVAGTFINGFLFVAVNCFVLISGYYGIKLKCKGIVNLYFTLAFWGLIGYFAYLLYSGTLHLGRSIILESIRQSILIISNSEWWFVNAYLMLMLFSPILNAAILCLDKRQHMISILLLLILQVYFGNFRHTFGLNFNGYSVNNFVLLYMIGNYIHRFVSQSIIDKFRWRSFASYCVCAVVWSILAIITHEYSIASLHVWTYNNIFTLIGGISLFGFMLSFHFYSRFINWMAVSTLAVYLAHGGKYSIAVVFGTVKMYSGIFGMSLCAQWLFLFVSALSFFLFILLVDKIRYYVFNYLFNRYWMKIVFEKCDKILCVF